MGKGERSVHFPFSFPASFLGRLPPFRFRFRFRMRPSVLVSFPFVRSVPLPASCWSSCFRPAFSRRPSVSGFGFVSVSALCALCRFRFRSVAASVPLFRSVPLRPLRNASSFPFPSLCCAAVLSRFRFRSTAQGKERKGHRKPHEAKQRHGVNRKRNGATRATGGRGGGNRHFVHSFTLQGGLFFPPRPHFVNSFHLGGLLSSIPHFVPSRSFLGASVCSSCRFLSFHERRVVLLAAARRS